MSPELWIGFIFIGFCFLMAVLKFTGVIPDPPKKDATEETFGPINPAMICPHCQTRGVVRTKAITQKKGISGGKATAAVLTGGVSMVATGLSRKEDATQAKCDTCGSKWVF